MRSVSRLSLLVLVMVLWLPTRAAGQAEPWYQSDFPPEEFQARWAKIFDRIGEDAVALVQGVAMTNGFIYPRQTNEFYYLCGVETPGSYILLDGRDRRVTLYLPPRNRRLESSEGRVLSADDAELVRQLTGADEVRSTEAMRGDWLAGPRGRGPRTIYTPFSPAEGSAQSRYELNAANAAIAADYWDGRVPREAHFASLLRARYPRAEVADLSPILDELRNIKSPREIALIRRASEIAAFGILEAMKTTRPGLYEYQLDAAARYVFLVNGARLEGYRSITASGTDNIWNAHYYRNASELKDGDLVLMDYAPDYHYYVSDITRMWPVNGTFAPWQRELLGFVLEYHKAILGRIRPGVSTSQIMEEAKAAMEPVFARWTFSKPIYEEAARDLVNRGGGVFSHTVGMAVHDVARYADAPLRPGQVFAVDPQLRVPEERLYIRYEDVVVVTETGVENFTDFLVTELDEIEATVRQGGIVQDYPLKER
ncbi:MAG: M24 family metallopeptidase [Gemmatimonadetes bacterium]|nr:M24 family metallopeptidase [Gemmatimonadota bacterium]NIO32708.1 M24 family metallopeptidase [Gemmatimonadota bacterium]